MSSYLIATFVYAPTLDKFIIIIMPYFEPLVLLFVASLFIVSMLFL